MKYVFIVKIKSGNSNIQIEDGIIGDWRYSWTNNQIVAITSGSNKVNSGISTPFNELETPSKLGLLVDVLSFCSDLAVSAKIDYDLYEVNTQNRIQLKNAILTFSDVLSQVLSYKHLQHGSSSDDWPIRIQSNTSHTFNNEKLELTKYLLDSLSTIKYQNTRLKLINYWRRSFDLNGLTYWDESFLACFKILEYFEGLYKKGNNKLVDKRIKLVKTKTKKRALKIGGGVNLSKVDNFLVQLLSDSIIARNRFDIAHMRIRPLPNSRDGALYFTYYDSIWDLHYDLLELTRFFILKYFSIPGVGLKVDGGLLQLHLIR